MGRSNGCKYASSLRGSPNINIRRARSYFAAEFKANASFPVKLRASSGLSHLLLLSVLTTLEGDVLYPETTPSVTKTYAIRQIDSGGSILSELAVEAVNSDAAAKQLEDVFDATERIAVCLDGQAMNEMDVEHWRKRIRRR